MIGGLRVHSIGACDAAMSREIWTFITLLLRHVFDHDRWSASTRLTRGCFALRPIDVPPSATSPETKITVWDFSPTRKRLVKSVGFINPDGLRGSNTLLVYERLKTPIYIVYNININIYAA